MQPPMQGPPPGQPGWGPGVPPGGTRPIWGPGAPAGRAPHGLDAIMGTGAPTETLAGPGGDSAPRRRPPWVLLTVLLILLLASGGTAAALVLTGHHGAKHPQAGGTTKPPPPPSSTPATPTQTPTTASPSPTSTPGLVQVAPGVAGNPQTPRIAAMLSQYFKAINSRDYFGYYALLSPQQQQQTSQSQFDNGFATTRDGGATLQSLSPGPGGTTVATVTFTSHQNPADSVDRHESCTRWRISLYLQHAGNGYVISKPPPTYRASYAPC
jgi:hypothetical protein